MSKPSKELLCAIAAEFSAWSRANIATTNHAEAVGRFGQSFAENDFVRAELCEKESSKAFEALRTAQKAVDWYMPNLPADPSERFASLRRFIDEMHREVVPQAEERLQIPNLPPDWVSPYK